MNTTTVSGTGINGQNVRHELPAIGEVIELTTGTTKNRTYRKVVGQVTAHTTRSITGTEFCVWQVTVRTAEGELITDTRFHTASDEQIAEYQAATAPAAPAAEVPFEIVSDEQAASLAHEAACIDCRVAGETGKHCPEGQALWTAAHRADNDLTRTPIILVNRWGSRRGFWDARLALAYIGFQGWELQSAPAGMIEAGRAAQAKDRAEAQARRR